MRKLEEKTIIFGTGKYYKNREKSLSGVCIIAFLDNSPDKQGTVFDNKYIYSPEYVNKLDYDRIILMSSYHESMKKQLLGLGIPLEKIWNYDEYMSHRYRCKMEIYGKDPDFFSEGKRMLFISNTIDYSGAPIACVYACQALKKRGYRVAILSPIADERMVEEVIDRGITVLIYRYLLNCKQDDIWFVRLFDSVIVNTFSMISVVDSVSLYIKPTIWIHEANAFYSSKDRDRDSERLKKANIKVVSTLADNNFKKHFPGIDTSLMAYGISEDVKIDLDYSPADNIISIGIIGDICKRKGQLEFVKSLNRLSDEYLRRLEVKIIGSVSNKEYGDELFEEIKNKDYIYVLGRKTRNEMSDVYKDIDVVAVPSEDDPLPIVATEGMMYGKVCMVSDRTGTADYIRDKENGLIIKYGDEDDIRNQIIWLLNNLDKYRDMARRSRRIYEENFSLDSFADRLEELFKER